MSDQETQTLQRSIDLHRSSLESRKAGKLQLAERQCRAAIEASHSIGWPAQGYIATLGMIYWEQGDKKLGFTTLRDSWNGFHGSAEAELYLGRMAIELKEYKTAREVVDRFRIDGAPAGPAPSGTRTYWPAGNDPKSLQATIEFLDGYRLGRARETRPEGIKLLMHANKLVPDNVAICYSTARVLETNKNSLAPAPYYRVVSAKGNEDVKAVADRWLAKNRKSLEKAEEGKERKVS